MRSRGGDAARYVALLLVSAGAFAAGLRPISHAGPDGHGDVARLTVDIERTALALSAERCRAFGVRIAGISLKLLANSSKRRTGPQPLLERQLFVERSLIDTSNMTAVLKPGVNGELGYAYEGAYAGFGTNSNGATRVPWTNAVGKGAYGGPNDSRWQVKYFSAQEETDSITLTAPTQNSCGIAYVK